MWNKVSVQPFKAPWKWDHMILFSHIATIFCWCKPLQLQARMWNMSQLHPEITNTVQVMQPLRYKKCSEPHTVHTKLLGSWQGSEQVIQTLIHQIVRWTNTALQIWVMLMCMGVQMKYMHEYPYDFSKHHLIIHASATVNVKTQPLPLITWLYSQCYLLWDKLSASYVRLTFRNKHDKEDNT